MIQSITIKLYGAAASICRVTVPVGAEPALPQDPFPVVEDLEVADSLCGSTPC